MEHMDVEDGSDVVGGTLDDECTVASPPLLPEEASSAMAIELGEGLGASAPGDDDGNPHGERVASLETERSCTSSGGAARRGGR